MADNEYKIRKVSIINNSIYVNIPKVYADLLNIDKETVVRIYLDKQKGRLIIEPAL